MKSPIIAFFKMIRWPNLLIVVLTQLLIWLCIIRPMGHLSDGGVLFLQYAHFMILSLTTVLIAAAGYIINDYYDRDIDQINKPGKVIVGEVLSVRLSLCLYVLLNLTALGLSVYLSSLQRTIVLAGIQLFCMALLWLYAAVLKAKPVWGNLAVAMLTALTIVILMAYEPAMYSVVLRPSFHKSVLSPLWLIGVYTFFAFMMTWIREIVKDMEDVKGDAAAGCQTLPIVVGVRVASRLVVVLGIVTVVALLLSALLLMFSGWMMLSVYLIVVLVIPILLLIAGIGKSSSSEHYATWSRRLKLIMLAGILALPLYYLLAFVLSC